MTWFQTYERKGKLFNLKMIKKKSFPNTNNEKGIFDETRAVMCSWHQKNQTTNLQMGSPTNPVSTNLKGCKYVFFIKIEISTSGNTAKKT
jgi:hypothetical protein